MRNMPLAEVSPEQAAIKKIVWWAPQPSMGWRRLHRVLNNRLAPVLRGQFHAPRREFLLGLAGCLLQGKYYPLVHGCSWL